MNSHPEAEFLKQYRLEDYERPSVTSDIALFSIRTAEEESYRHEPEHRLCLLLIRRGAHPFQGCWALPGGFLRSDETVEECALREISEETGASPTALRHVGVYSNVNRDPRGRIVSNAFLAVSRDGPIQVQGGTDAAEAQWFTVGMARSSDGWCLRLVGDAETISCTLREEKRFGRTLFRVMDSGGLAFDHGSLIAEAIFLLRREAAQFRLVFDFLPARFTLTALQRVQETITGKSTQAANFRRKAAEYVRETEEMAAGAGHRPAKLYEQANEQEES